MKKVSSFLALLVASAITSVSAQGQFDLLSIPSKSSHLANKSIITNLIRSGEKIIAVGERGHILTWSAPEQWQQHSVPVSLTLTDLTIAQNNLKFVVGHDSVILKSDPDSDIWSKVFDGNELTKLKIALTRKKIATLQQQLSELTDEYEIEELEINIEDLEFNIEDAQAELEDGPNKPLLGITVSHTNELFAVGAYGTLLTSSDLGNTWQLIDQRIDNPDQYHLNSIVTADNGFMYIVGENGVGFSSQDNGQTWQNMSMPYEGSLFGIATKEDSLVAFGLQGNFMVSNDKGASWEAANIGSSASLLGGVIGDDMTANLVGHGGIIVRFNVNDIANFKLHRHPSSAVFSSVVILQNNLVLAGQFGMTTWLIK